MTEPVRVLVLGGTSEARELVAHLSGVPGLVAIASLAGRTREPLALATTTRVGGFGGVAGLTRYLRDEGIAALIDATHPFAAQISHHAAEAAAAVGLPRLMLVRPAWEPVAGDRWQPVANHAAAAAQVPDLGQRIFLSIGRQELAAFAPLQNLWFLMRAIDPPAPELPLPPGELLLQRGPFALDEERSLLQRYGIEAVVSKNSGGAATYAKIAAARELQLPVVMVQRPPLPVGEQVASAAAAIAWLQQQLPSGGFKAP